MLDSLLSFIKGRLISIWGGNNKIGDIDIVNYVDYSSDPPAFRAKINILLTRVEEETQLRAAERYLQQDEEGRHFKSQPPLRLNIYLLIAVKPTPSTGTTEKWYNYEDAMKYLSKVLAFFQANPVFSADMYPDLPEVLDKLVVELVPLTYTQQNEIWSSLKTAFLPSVCYKIKMLHIQEQPAVGEAEIESLGTNPKLT